MAPDFNTDIITEPPGTEVIGFSSFYPRPFLKLSWITKTHVKSVLNESTV